MGQPNIWQTTLSRSSTTSCFLNFSFDVTREQKVRVKCIFLKNDPSTTIENPYFIIMVRDNFTPGFQPVLHQTCQHDILFHYVTEK